jgi:hypothetical protein
MKLLIYIECIADHYFSPLNIFKYIVATIFNYSDYKLQIY